jgi:hypothetical protein
VPQDPKRRAKIAAKEEQKLILDGPSFGGKIGYNSCRTDHLRKQPFPRPRQVRLNLGKKIPSSAKLGETDTKFTFTW